jgi:hypothetical protein
LPPEVVERMRSSPDWPSMERLAHTLPYDIALAADTMLPAARLGTIAIPVVAVDGGRSPAWARNAVATVADAIPGARRVTIDGQAHGVSPDAIASVLVEHLG